MANTEQDRKEKDAAILSEDALEGITGGSSRPIDGGGIFPGEPGSVANDKMAEMLEALKKAHPEIGKTI